MFIALNPKPVSSSPTSFLRGESFAAAMMKDTQKVIRAMKEQHASLQEAVTQLADEQKIANLTALLKASYAEYDDKMKAAKRALRPPASKAKAKGKAKAVAPASG